MGGFSFFCLLSSRSKSYRMQQLCFVFAAPNMTSSTPHTLNAVHAMVETQSHSKSRSKSDSSSRRRLQRLASFLTTVFLGMMIAIFLIAYSFDGPSLLFDGSPTDVPSHVELQLSNEELQRVIAGETIHVRIPSGCCNQTKLLPINAENLFRSREEMINDVPYYKAMNS